MAYAIIPFVMILVILLVLLLVLLNKRGSLGQPAQQGQRMQQIARSGNGFTAIQEIYQDTQTGVQYFVIRTGYGTAITPLLDAEGKPYIARFNERDSRFD